MIVHRNLEVPALKVGVRGSDPVAFAISPRNLEDVQWADEAVIWEAQSEYGYETRRDHLCVNGGFPCLRFAFIWAPQVPSTARVTTNP